MQKYLCLQTVMVPSLFIDSHGAIRITTFPQPPTPNNFVGWDKINAKYCQNIRYFGFSFAFPTFCFKFNSLETDLTALSIFFLPDIIFDTKYHIIFVKSVITQYWYRPTPVWQK